MSAGQPDKFLYAPLPQPLTLPPGSSYYLVSEESAGGDRWYDVNTIVTPGFTNARVTSGVWGANNNWFPVLSTGFTYGPVDFRFR